MFRVVFLRDDDDDDDDDNDTCSDCDKLSVYIGRILWLNGNIQTVLFSSERKKMKK